MDFSYIGVGKVYMREVDSAAGLVEVGNVSALSLTINEDSKELKDYTQVGGGTYNEVVRIDSVELGATLHDLNADNLARVMFGAASAISVTPITDEAHTAYEGAFIPTDYPSTGTIVVKGDAGVTTHVLDTDYSRVDGGIVVIAGAGITDADAITFDYTPSAGNAVQALVTTAKEYEVFFSGLNEARSGKQVTFLAHRWKPGAASNIGLITDDHAALELSGKLLKDQTKNGTTVSQYFQQQIVT